GGAANPENAGEHEAAPERRPARGERDPDSRRGKTAGREQDRPPPVRPEAEERLDQRRGGGRREDEGRGEGVGEREAVAEEGQERRERPVREVRPQVPGGKRRHRALVDSGSHHRTL